MDCYLQKLRHVTYVYFVWSIIKK